MKGHGWDAVHHFVPSVYPNDGVGGHVVRSAAAQRVGGRRSEIFVESVHPETSDLCQHVSTLNDHIDPRQQTLFVYHAATGSTLPALLLERDEPLVVQHHSLTPIELVAPWSPEVVPDIALGRRQLVDLARRAVLGIGDSAHNARELSQLGYRRTAVAPIMLRPELVATNAQPRPVKSPPTVLFVGRIAANKAHHDLIKTTAVLRISMPGAKLRLVGATSSHRYRRALDRLVTSLGLTEAVTFTGRLSDAGLDQQYREADVFCCLSDHEGFGIPLVEAAHHALPIVAFDAAAVAETVGRGGVVLTEKSPAIVATALERVLTDVDLRTSLVAFANERLRELEPAKAAEQFEAAIGSLIDVGPAEVRAQ